VIAVGRLIKQHGISEAEFALLVSDAYQCKGLGSTILRSLLRVARAEQIERVTAVILPENRPMQRVCERLGFRLEFSPSGREVHAWIDTAPQLQSSNRP
jgi:acetyltransferase